MSLLKHLQIDIFDISSSTIFMYSDFYQANRYSKNTSGCAEFYIRLDIDNNIGALKYAQFCNAIPEKCKYFMDMREHVINAGGSDVIT